VSTTLATLRQRLLESMGDYISVAVTTAIAAGTSVVSTNLNEYDGGADDYFNNWYCYITDENNAGVERQVSDYATATGTLTVRGANLTDDGSDKATIWVCRHSVLQTVDKAINRAIEEIYPALHKAIDDQTLITGNHLPNASFEDWASSSYPDFYGVSNATAAETTTASLIRGQRGTTSALVTASAADGYMYISSDDYPSLLDLMNTTVDFYCWAYPSTANDAFLTIYTISNDGSTTQTLNSTTSCAANVFTRLELENQTLNDDLEEIQIRFRVHTNAETCCFDDAFLGGRRLFEYLIPDQLQNGNIDQVKIQLEGRADDVAAYDLHPRSWYEDTFSFINDGTYRFLTLDHLPPSRHRMRLIGTAPLDTLSAATGTINIDAGGRTDLLIAYANYLLYEMAESPVSSEDTSRYERESAKRYAKYTRLLQKHRMLTPAGRLNV